MIKIVAAEQFSFAMRTQQWLLADPLPPTYCRDHNEHAIP